jgi:hypothetical protein
METNYFEYHMNNYQYPENACNAITNFITFSLWFFTSIANIYYSFDNNTEQQHVAVLILTSFSSLLLVIIFCTWPLHNVQHILYNRQSEIYRIRENKKYKIIGIVIFLWTGLVLFNAFSVNNYQNINIIIASTYPVIAILVGSVIFKNQIKRSRIEPLLQNY